ncbi:MAG: glycosyltransferase family 2 protein [Caldilineaceae bacterium]|nr:glycosyltransferase family 2 protein [Caldilineaceae bacterium]HRJ44242.1 glycosyltransferase family 2 protein [Caldilineaceae bacterium]
MFLAQRDHNNRLMLKLTVVVVSYNVISLLRDCLESVAVSAAASADWLAVEVVVVDNASGDGSPAMVAADFPHVRLIASDANLGFTGGNNLALHALGFSSPGNEPTDTPISSPQSPLPNRQSPIPDFILLLNPDTLVKADALGQMATFLRDNPRVGAVGAHLSYGDGRFQHAAFRFPGLAQVVLDLLPLADLPGIRHFLPTLLNSPLNGRYPAALWQGTDAFPVDFVLGAALMVRGEAIRQVGLLDGGYFMYCEEMDWCLRLAEAGWSVYALPTAHIAHLEAQSSRQVRWGTFERLWRSRFRFYHKQRVHYSGSFLFFLRLLVRVGIGIRIALARRRYTRGKLSGALLADELAAYTAIRRL